MGLICLFGGERMKYCSYLLETQSIERTILHFFVSWINAGFERTRWDQSECQPYHLKIRTCHGRNGAIDSIQIVLILFNQEKIKIFDTQQE